MRDIEFRAKCKDNDEWTYGYLFQIWESTYILWGTTNGVPNMIEVNPETVGQYTGSSDKNDKKIFEGDVIRGTYGETTYQNKVIFADCGFALVHNHDEYGYCASLDEHENIELIGNTFDNPELIN